MSGYRCGECGKAKECSDTFCAWAGPEYTAARKIGRCANGAERGKGVVYHAVNGVWAALCGTQPGRQSAGRQSEPEPIDKVNCPRCLRKLASGSNKGERNG